MYISRRVTTRNEVEFISIYIYISHAVQRVENVWQTNEYHFI